MSDMDGAGELVEFTEVENGLDNDDGRVGTIGERAELRDKIKNLCDKIEEMSAEIGSSLYVVYKEKLFVSWGFKTFEDYLEADLDSSKRRCQYLLAIQKYFNEVLKDPELLKEMSSIGWTKLKEVLYLANRENKDYIVKLAHEMNANDFTRAVKMYKNDVLAKKDVITGRVDMTKAEHKQALDAAKEMVEKEHYVSFKFSDVQNQNVIDALAIAKEISRSDVQSNNMSLICLEFIANNSDFVKKDVDGFQTYLSRVEKELDVQIICIKDGKVIHGNDIVADDKENDKGVEEK